jgi:hypothetical protein
MHPVHDRSRQIKTATAVQRVVERDSNFPDQVDNLGTYERGCGRISDGNTLRTESEGPRISSEVIRLSSSCLTTAERVTSPPLSRVEARGDLKHIVVPLHFPALV